VSFSERRSAFLQGRERVSGFGGYPMASFLVCKMRLEAFSSGLDEDIRNA